MRFKPANKADQRELDEIITYSQYKFRQVSQLQDQVQE